MGSKYHRNAVVVGALPRTTLGEFTAPQVNWIWGRFAARRGGKVRKEGKGRKRGEILIDCRMGRNKET